MKIRVVNAHMLLINICTFFFVAAQLLVNYISILHKV